jgi:hypothetical protein
MAALKEVCAQVAVVVDLSVESDPDGFVFIRNRLVAAREVNDAEAAIAERDFALEIKSLIVRPAMGHGVRGAFQGDTISGRTRSEIENSANTAHWNCP